MYCQCHECFGSNYELPLDKFDLYLNKSVNFDAVLSDRSAWKSQNKYFFPSLF